MGDGSIFGDASLWTPANINALLDRFTGGNLIKGPGNFLDKMKRQLESSEPAVIQLAAECLWFLYLVPLARKKFKSKRNEIAQVWEWSGQPIPESDYLENRTLMGFARPGRAYSQYRHLEFRFLLRVAAKWKQLPDFQKDELSDENAAWKFAEWVDSQMEGRRQIRHAILFFLFPDYFERCVSHGDKRKIVGKLESRLPEDLRPNSKKAPIIEIDRAIYDIRRDLEKEYGDAPLDFYYPPIKKLWKPDHDEEDTKDPTLKTTPAKFNPLNTILYGPPGTGKTYATTARCVEICDREIPDSNEKIRARYAELIEEGRVEFITFHQSYGYEEFVEGLRPQTDPEGGAGFRLVPTDGVLKRIAERAQQSINPVPHVLVIDEINRANVSKVLGELVTLLEEDKRQGAENEISVALPHSGEHFSLPANLYILGTMNTADRSIALLDTALRRRFDFEELPPKPKLLKEAAESSGIDLPKVLRTMNERLEYLLDRDHLIGHAWLMNAKTREDVDRVMRHKIIPLIAEYFYDDWSKVCAVLGGIPNGFVERRNLDTPPNLDHATGEERYRWKYLDEFPENAYELLLGKSSDAEDPE